MIEYIGVGTRRTSRVRGVFYGGSWTLFRWQLETGLWVIVFSAVATFILLKLVGLFLPLRLTQEELEEGDHAIHGNEVYPSDVPTLGGPHDARVGRPPRRSRRSAPSATAHSQQSPDQRDLRPRAGGRAVVCGPAQPGVGPLMLMPT